MAVNFIAGVWLLCVRFYIFIGDTVNICLDSGGISVTPFSLSITFGCIGYLLRKVRPKCHHESNFESHSDEELFLPNIISNMLTNMTAFSPTFNSHYGVFLLGTISFIGCLFLVCMYFRLRSFRRRHDWWLLSLPRQHEFCIFIIKSVCLSEHMNA